MNKMRQNWQGGSTDKERGSGSKDKARSSKRFSLLEKERRTSKEEKKDNAGAMLAAVAQSGDPLQGLLALQIAQTLKKQGRRKKSHRSRSSSLESRSSRGSSTTSSGSDRSRTRGHGKAVYNYKKSKKRMVKNPVKYIKRFVKGIEAELGAEDRPFKITDYNRRVAFGKQRNLQRCHYLVCVILDLVVATRLQEGSPTNCLDTPSNAPGCTRPGLGNCMATYSCRGAIQEESLRRRPKCPPGCRFISEEPQRVVQIHRGSAKEEPRRSPGRRRKGQRERAIWKERQEQRQGSQERERSVNEQPRHPNLHTRPKNSGSAALHDRLESSWGSFGRFFRLMKSKSLSVDKGSGPRTLPERSRGDHLFPSMLVIPYASTQPSSSRRRARGRGREMAWGHVELLWTWFSFLEGGSPFKKSDQEALVARAQQVTWTKMHAEYAGCMHSEISKYIRLQSKQLQLSRGILKLSELVKVVKNSSYTSSSSIEKFCNVAKDVKPDRMSLPEVAGIINPTNYLKGTHKQAFLNMIHDVPLEEEPPDRVQGCFKVNEDDLQSVHFKLLSSGVAVLIPERNGSQRL